MSKRWLTKENLPDQSRGRSVTDMILKVIFYLFLFFNSLVFKSIASMWIFVVHSSDSSFDQIPKHAVKHMLQRLSVLLYLYRSLRREQTRCLLILRARHI